MNQAMNYRNTPFCYNFRDLDYASLQLALLVIGPEYFMKLLLVRCNMFHWIKQDFQSDDFGKGDSSQGKDRNSSGDRNVLKLTRYFNDFDGQGLEQSVREEAVPHLLAEMLLLCVNLVTEVPIHLPLQTRKEEPVEDSCMDGDQEADPTARYVLLLEQMIRRALVHAICNTGDKGLKHSKANEIVHKIAGEFEERVNVKQIMKEVLI